MNHESSDLPQKSEHENVEYTEHLKHADETGNAQPLAPSEVGSVFAEYRRRQLNIFRERESTLELDDTAI
ncbi:hypothetical protein KIV56_17955 [Cryobacterium breve]|jgi:hypothetical protein|uniref:Uncharacterized protein n=1 Tax=Cryobacterium breve TaxID=1259258 RepID=A0ABY7NGN9_9MICO|nr:MULTISPECIES: hypothetical protein [Cryobacterium]MDY7543448.1 hypothetical protein [Cryobacterium sp. 5B3]MEA9999544.1 hypothetical protein [Cryobacterium sp. RTS3]MEB0264907.1 hypothetical protein [Cryobacterium sp. 10I5]MEB0274663.1 hypothetical protein [Cryobacterium sp. 5B3]WBM80001.1 hypothetical protein KIV56_17955 [Cryobacterium breve]